jgi:hypothetical protein
VLLPKRARTTIDLGDALNVVETWFSEVVYEADEWKRVELELKNEAEGGQEGRGRHRNNLDRVTYKDLGDGRTSHDALFIEHGDQLCGLRCHTVYTVPISMMYGMSARNLDGIFARSHVLPMIKSHRSRAQGGGDEPAGMGRLRDIIGQRVDADALCEPEAVEYFCRACGVTRAT